MPKCGTTDMMWSIMNHPDVVPPIDKDGTILKEIHFFDNGQYKKECTCMYNSLLYSECTLIILWQENIQKWFAVSIFFGSFKHYNYNFITVVFSEVLR